MVIIMEESKRIAEVSEIKCFPDTDPKYIFAYLSNGDDRIIIASDDNKCIPNTESKEVTWEEMTIFQKWDEIKEKILYSTNGTIQLPV